MDKISGILKNRICVFVCIVFLIQGCNIGADSVEKLSGGYFYRNEGGDIKDIYCERPDGGEIPATVIDFAYDRRFIVAKQKPKIPQDPLYDKDYQYKDGVDKIYFWLIIHEKNLVLGPMNEEEFTTVCKKYNVSEKLIKNFIN